MKRILLFLFLGAVSFLLLLTASCSVTEEPITISDLDMNFNKYLVDNFDVDGDRKISLQEASVVKEMRCPGLSITSLNGIEYFITLSILDVSDNYLSNLDVSKNTQLNELNCANNKLTNLDVSKNTQLNELNCADNKLTNLDVSKNTQLSELNCKNNQLSNLDVSKNTQLSELNCENNQLSNLDVSKNTQLSELTCDNNQLSNLDVSKNTQLSELNCKNNQLSNLDVSKNTQLSELTCDNNQLAKLDVTTNKQLIELSFNNNQLSNIDISKNALLTTLECNSNNLECLDVSYNRGLEYLDCGNGEAIQSPEKNVSLSSSRKGNQITYLDVSHNDKLSTLLFYVEYEATVVLAYGQEIDNFGYNPDNTNVVSPDAIDLGLSVKWASFNIGASSPEEYGDYYAWGEIETKSKYDWSTYFDSIEGSHSLFYKYYFDGGKTILDPEDDVAYVKWGGKWRMPTIVECKELIDHCDSEWTTLNGVNGMKFISRKNGNSIFLPAAGERYGSSFYYVGSLGHYWFSSLYPYYSYFARNLSFSSDYVYRDFDSREDGCSVRPVIPTGGENEDLNIDNFIW